MSIDDKEFGHEREANKPRLLMTHWVKGEPIAYKCSHCSQLFLLPEDRNPKEGAAELWAAFKDHIHAEHSDGV